MFLGSPLLVRKARGPASGGCERRGVGGADGRDPGLADPAHPALWEPQGSQTSP